MCEMSWKVILSLFLLVVVCDSRTRLFFQTRGLTAWINRKLQNDRLPRVLLRTQYKKFRNLIRPTDSHCTYPTPFCDDTARYRTADGYCNNLEHPSWGTPGWPFRRALPPQYDDGVNEPRTRGTDKTTPLPSPRTVSQTLHSHDSQDTVTTSLTSMFTQWGQFLDHDIDLTPLTNGDSELDCCEETIQFPVRNFYVQPPLTASAFMFKSRPLPGTCFPITIPQPDRYFSSNCMNFVRSRVFAPSFKCRSATREQGNAVTSFIDASQVYGSTIGQQDSLRTFVGGQLKGGDMLPTNSSTTCKAARLPGKYCFGAGDTRVNEQPMLSALHIVFHRFHNQLAQTLATLNPTWADEHLFQEARKIIGAIMQHIVYTEYLPLVLGSHYMKSHGLNPSSNYRYEPKTDPRILNEFATAAFRFGHSMVPGHLMFGSTRKSLDSVFFSPHDLQDDNGDGLSNLISGTSEQLSQQSDRFFSSTVSDTLFKDGGRSLDLVSLNVQRGRDHGLPPYNDYRQACGMGKQEGSSESNRPFLEVYRDMADVDLFSGALAEAHVPGGIVGNTFACIIARQFRDLKYGDRFWYENLNPNTGFSEDQIRELKKVSLSSVLCAGSGVSRLQRKIFVPVSSSNPSVPCREIPTLDLSFWKN